MKKGLIILLNILTLLVHSQTTGKIQINNKSNPVVAAVKMNILYVQIDNPIMVAVPSYNCEDLHVSVTNGTVTGEGCKYFVNPKKVGLTDVIVSTVQNNDTVVLGKTTFRVKPIPNPIPVFCGKKSGETIEKQAALSCYGLMLIFLNADFDISFKVTHFDLVMSLDNCETIRLISEGAKLTNQMKQALKKIKPGNILAFENIKGLAPDGRILEIEDLRLIIK